MRKDRACFGTFVGEPLRGFWGWGALELVVSGVGWLLVLRGLEDKRGGGVRPSSRDLDLPAPTKAKREGPFVQG